MFLLVIESVQGSCYQLIPGPFWDLWTCMIIPSMHLVGVSLLDTGVDLKSSSLLIGLINVDTGKHLS